MQRRICPFEYVLFCFVIPQVNAGPLAYAQGFLDKSVLASHPHKHIEKLQQVYRSVTFLFLPKLCETAA